MTQFEATKIQSTGERERERETTAHIDIHTYTS
jgi:hypothetical protein